MKDVDMDAMEADRDAARARVREENRRKVARHAPGLLRLKKALQQHFRVKTLTLEFIDLPEDAQASERDAQASERTANERNPEPAGAAGD